MRDMQIDGVPVFVADGPSPSVVGLVFGVGRADETFVRGGLTHLVEHLAMSAPGRTTYECNASVDLRRTEFTATGTPEQVRDFLELICRALGDLPLDRLRVEVDVLRTEGAAAAPPAVGTLLTERYGLTGPGLGGVREPALTSLTAEDVRDWARTWFTRGNAALWVTGPVPAGLRLPLPDGEPPARPPLWRSPVPTPAWTETGSPGAVSLGGELPPGIAGSVTLEVLRRRVEDALRHRRGVAYAVTADRLPLDAVTRFGVLVTDVRAGQEDLVAAVLWREVQRLADEGPTADELEHERRSITDALDAPRSEAEEVVSRAESRVTGVPAYTSADLRQDVALLGIEDIRRTAGLLRDGALLGVPEPLEPAPAGIPRAPVWSEEAVDGRVFQRRRRRGVPKGATLVVGDDGVSAVLEQGVLTVRWADAVALVRQGPGDHLLLGRDGFSVPLSEADWRDGEQALVLVRAAVDGALQIDDDGDAEDAGLLLVRAPAYRIAEAVAMGRHGATLVGNDEWTVVLADGDRLATEVAAELSSVGRRTTALVLRQSHADLGYQLLRGAEVVDQHLWGLTPGDAAQLAEATGRHEPDMVALLGLQGAPAEIVPHAVAGLGLPAQVHALLADPSSPVDGLRVEGRGIAGGARASFRGDFLPAAETVHGLDRYRALSRSRPGWFRAANAAAAMVYALIAWGVIAWREHLDSWQVWVPLVLCVLSLPEAVLNTRPPHRSAGTASSTGGPPADEEHRALTG